MSHDEILSIGLKLASLNPQQIAKVAKLVDKLSSKAGVQLEEGSVSKGGNNPPNTSTGRPPAPAGSNGESAGLHQIKKTASEPSRLRKQLDDQKIAPIKRRGQGAPDKGKQARREPIYLGARENKFLELEEESGRKIIDTSKEDTVDFDKKVWKGHKPVPRGKRQAQVEIQCIECNRVFEISANYPMPESGYVCNDCIVSRRH